MEGVLEINHTDDINFCLEDIPEESKNELLEEQMTPLNSIDGWVLFITSIHEEATDDDILAHFSDYGKILNLHLNLDRRTGFVKGYAVIEYAKYEEADNARESLDGTLILGLKIRVSWCFVRDSYKSFGANKNKPKNTHSHMMKYSRK